MQNEYTWDNLAILSFYQEIENDSGLIENERVKKDKHFNDTLNILRWLDKGFCEPSEKCLQKIEKYAQILHDLKKV